MVEPGEKASTKAYIGLGSNEGDREKALGRALCSLTAHPGIAVSEVSPVYETEPLGMEGEAVLNAAATVITSLNPWQLLEVLLEIEKSMGRTRLKGCKTARVIDLDLLLFGGTVLKSKELTIPHPRMTVRMFVLMPLADLDPQLRIPGEEKTVVQMVENLKRQHPRQSIRLFGTLDLQLMESL